MAVIDQYTSNVLAQGQVNSQASPQDFGSQVGGALANVGAVVQDINDTQDVTNVHVEMAKKRAEWTQQLRDRENAAVPGDDTFAPKLMEDMGKDLTSLGNNITSRKAQNLLTTMSATMTSEFGQRAVGIQAELAGKAAVNSYNDLVKYSGQTVYNDPSQYDAVMAEAEAAVKNGSGMFGKVDGPRRQEFLSRIRDDINLAAARGVARTSPEALLASVAPDQLQQFEPDKKVVEINVAPGGKADIRPPAMKWAPYVQQAAAARGVNPNVLLAQIDKESGGNPNARNDGDIRVTGKPSIGLAQFQPATAAQYGIDPTDPRQSIKGQAAYMSDLLKKYGGSYEKALAAYNWGPGNLDNVMKRWGNAWPERLPASTKEYVSTILAKAGQTTPQNPPVGENSPPNIGNDTPMSPDTAATQVAAPAAPAAPKTPVASSMPFFNALSWEKQDAVIGEAVRLQHMKMTMAEHQRAQAELAAKKAQEQLVDGYQRQILNPQKYGAFDAAKVNDDPNLKADQKLHLVQTAMTIDRQNRDPKNHPEEVNRLMSSIAAGYDDPTKVYNANEAREALRLGRINAQEYTFLEGQVEKMRDGAGNSFQRQVLMAHKKAEDMFMKDFTATLPGGAAYASDALYRFRFDLDRKINDMRQKNQDPSGLLDPGSRDYMLTPDRMKAYMPKAMQLMQDQAGKTVEAAKATLPTFNEYDKLKSGDQYTDPQGNVRTKK